MAILKCKNCGGDIERSEDKTYGICEYCGSTMTFPKVGDEQRLAAYNRGNHFRRIGEFDKALSVYEKIVEEEPTDAEAHWCCALCRFGIEYVEDPATYEYIPTCHRASFDSFLNDIDYLAAIDNSEGPTKRQYLKEASRIADVQRGILSTCSREEPFDVFICYKETDDNGNRTKDSALAQDIYYRLTDQGLRVFFARITLEEKTGSEYEPYIFAALNSAKVMVTVSTRPEYLNAVWVKNEWSRFLGIIRKDRSRVILPCYRDMDPYDLPEQLSVLQSYDMSKIGFIQDLIRGIRKIVHISDQDNIQGASAAGTGAGAVNVINTAFNVDSMLERAFLFLEDGKWHDADIYCEKVLDNDPKNANAYLGKLMAQLHVKNRTQLADYNKPLDGFDNYQKILRFGDKKIVEELQGYNAKIIERNKAASQSGIYDRAVAAMGRADSEKSYKAAADMFLDVGDFKDAVKLKKECLKKAEICRKDETYVLAMSKMSGEKLRDLNEAKSLFETIPGWSDTDKQLSACEIKIREAEEREEIIRIQVERRDQELNEQAEVLIETFRSEAVQSVREDLRNALQQKIVECDRMRQLMESFDQNLQEINELNWNMQMYQNQAVEIAEKKNSLSVFAIKEKKQLDAELTGIIDALNGERSRLDVVQGMLCGCQTKDEMTGLYNSVMNEKRIMEDDLWKKEIHFQTTLRYSYEEAKAILRENEQLYQKVCSIDPAAVIACAEKGEGVYFGKYKQDLNAPKPVKWIILEKKDGRALLISKFGLDCRKYHDVLCRTTWENSDIRKWLNSTFLNTAFSSEEQAIIQETNITEDFNGIASAGPCCVPRDRIFLLSINEVNKYFESNEARKCIPTGYAVSQGASVNVYNGTAACKWWLRSQGNNFNNAAYVFYMGSVYCIGDFVDCKDDCVRPALWVKM